ncbi:MAG: toll/interleukin-1 receptor domain-containing protein [Candidatus Competibacter sp.]|nr:toll/interleukin-1 receptor domain-containing protein [Candidatus Competibacter sp.]
MAKIFVSHAHEDRDAAHQITTALAKARLDPWLDVQELRPGDELLKAIAAVLAEADYFAILLSRTALAKPWVLTEMRMALTAEIEKGRPKVVVLRLDGCEVPIELKHKLYLDLRGRFDAALAELADHIEGLKRAVATPKQTILADMIKNADHELWTRLSAGAGSRDEWRQSEAAEAIRELRSDELEAAVRIGSRWSGQVYKEWEGDLVKTIRHATDVSDAGARRILISLCAAGFLEEADDLDYDRQPERAWCDGSILWILRRAARRSGLFPALPPPLPERLSSLLAYEGPVGITGKGWFAIRFATGVLTALDTSDKVVVAVARQADSPRTWGFRSSDDRAPLKLERYLTPTDLTPEDPFASLSKGRALELVGFDLATFDDLGLLL